MEAAAADRVPLIFVHGAWLSSGSWENFSDYFAHRGFDVSAPEWPRKQGAVEELREASDDIKGLGITEIVDHYEEQIDALDEPPVLIGHSFGGLIVELLLDRGSAGQARDEARRSQGHGAVLIAESCGAGTRASVEMARRRAADARGVLVRLRE